MDCTAKHVTDGKYLVWLWTQTMRTFLTVNQNLNLHKTKSIRYFLERKFTGPFWSSLSLSSLPSYPPTNSPHLALSRGRCSRRVAWPRRPSDEDYYVYFNPLSRRDLFVQFVGPLVLPLAASLLSKLFLNPSGFDWSVSPCSFELVSMRLKITCYISCVTVRSSVPVYHSHVT